MHKQRQQTGIKNLEDRTGGIKVGDEEQRLEGSERYQETANEPRWTSDLHSEGSVQPAVGGADFFLFLLWKSVLSHAFRISAGAWL